MHSLDGEANRVFIVRSHHDARHSQRARRHARQHVIKDSIVHRISRLVSAEIRVGGRGEWGRGSQGDGETKRERDCRRQSRREEG